MPYICDTCKKQQKMMAVLREELAAAKAHIDQIGEMESVAVAKLEAENAALRKIVEEGKHDNRNQA